MRKNIHDKERIFRFLFGAFLSSLAFWGPKKKAFLSFGLLWGTGLVGTCPLYSFLGISTRPGKKDNEYFPVQSVSERAAGHPIVGVT